MAKATFDQLKSAVVMKAEESGTLPTTVVVGGNQYTLDIPVAVKVAAMNVIRNPAKLDEMLDGAQFIAKDGSHIAH